MLFQGCLHLCRLNQCRDSHGAGSADKNTRSMTVAALKEGVAALRELIWIYPLHDCRGTERRGRGTERGEIKV